MFIIDDKGDKVGKLGIADLGEFAKELKEFGKEIQKGTGNFVMDMAMAKEFHDIVKTVNEEREKGWKADKSTMILLNERYDKAKKSIDAYKKKLEETSDEQDELNKKTKLFGKISGEVREAMKSNIVQYASWAGAIGLGREALLKWSESIDKAVKADVAAGMIFNRTSLEMAIRADKATDSLGKVARAALNSRQELEAMSDVKGIVKYKMHLEKIDIEGLLTRVGVMAKVTGQDVGEMAEQMLKEYRNMGRGTQEFLANQQAIALQVDETNRILGKGTIEFSDYYEVLKESVFASDRMGQSTRFFSRILRDHMIQVQSTGGSYKEAIEGAKALAKVIQEPPEWVQWRTGLKMLEQIKNMGEEELKIFFNSEKIAKRIVKLRGMGMDKRVMAKAIEDLIRETSPGIEATLNEYRKIKNPIALMNQLQLENINQAIDVMASLQRTGEGGAEETQKMIEKFKKEKEEKMSAKQRAESDRAMREMLKRVKREEAVRNSGFDERIKKLKDINDSYLKALDKTVESLKNAPDKVQRWFKQFGTWLNKPAVLAAFAALSGAAAVGFYAMNIVEAKQRKKILKEIRDDDDGIDFPGKTKTKTKSKTKTKAARLASKGVTKSSKFVKDTIKTVATIAPLAGIIVIPLAATAYLSTLPGPKGVPDPLEEVLGGGAYDYTPQGSVLDKYPPPKTKVKTPKIKDVPDVKSKDVVSPTESTSKELVKMYNEIYGSTKGDKSQRIPIPNFIKSGIDGQGRLKAFFEVDLGGTSQIVASGLRGIQRRSTQ